MNIFFDVDETILGYDGSLRPLVAEVFGRLIDEGHRIYVWSGVRTGDTIRTEVVEPYALEPYVTDCFRKPLFEQLPKVKAIRQSGQRIVLSLILQAIRELPLIDGDSRQPAGHLHDLRVWRGPGPTVQENDAERLPCAGQDW